jgi:hypothetical protein
VTVRSVETAGAFPETLLVTRLVIETRDGRTVEAGCTEPVWNPDDTDHEVAVTDEEIDDFAYYPWAETWVLNVGTAGNFAANGPAPHVAVRTKMEEGVVVTWTDFPLPDPTDAP